jgi:hypothetical protein
LLNLTGITQPNVPCFREVYIQIWSEVTVFL